jgi:hypothetical protein
MTRSTDETVLHLAGWGTAEADLASLPPLRKALPAWAPEGTPGHFLKHADEQTVVAVAALDRAVHALGCSPERFADWSIIAAPQCVGRLAGVNALDRFTKGGAPAISPHLIPQHSLHSVSGAMSILLGSRQPNFGVGGSRQSLAEGLLAALTLPCSGASGVWMIATGWDPEPVLDAAGACTNSPTCFAVALALETRAASTKGGHLRLHSSRLPPQLLGASQSPDAASLCRLLSRLLPSNVVCHWPLDWGGAITLEAHAAAVQLAAAA